jgi:hypothetical protein
MGSSAKVLACKAFKEKLAKGLEDLDSSCSFLNAIDATTWSIFMSNLQYNGNQLVHADCTRLAEKLDRDQIAEVLANFGVSDEQFASWYNHACILFECETIPGVYCDAQGCRLPES